MDTETFIKRHPKLWHMAEDGAWPKIREHGLLSTTALLNLFGYAGEERQHIESERRPKRVPITHPDHGTAFIRDNRPLSEKKLLACLEEDMSPREWYELLNRKVFFWVSKDRLESMLDAYEDRAHDVIVVDSRQLIARDGDRITLSPINSGAVLYNPAKRGSGTFRSIQEYDLAAMIKRRHGNKDAIIELAVDCAVYDLEAISLRVVRRHGSLCQLLWERLTV